MINSQIPFNQLKPLRLVDVKERRSLFQAMDVCKHALFHLNGYLDAAGSRQVSDFINLLYICDTKYSFDLEDDSISIHRLFESRASGSKMKDASALRILKFFEWFQKNPETDIQSLEPVYLNTGKKSIDFQRERKEQRIQSYFTKLTLYTAPNQSSVLRELKADLDDAMKNRQDLDPLVSIALCHFQFRTLCPYTLFNGHVARVYTCLTLKSMGLDYNVLPLAMVLNKQKEKYNALIREVVLSGDYTPWCKFLIEVLEQASQLMLAKLKRFEHLSKQMSEQLHKYTPYHLPAFELHQLLLRHPYVNTQTLIQGLQCHRQSAYVYLDHLVNMGLLIEKVSGREKLYYNREFLDILSDN